MALPGVQWDVIGEKRLFELLERVCPLHLCHPFFFPASMKNVFGIWKFCVPLHSVGSRSGIVQWLKCIPTLHEHCLFGFRFSLSLFTCAADIIICPVACAAKKSFPSLMSFRIVSTYNDISCRLSPFSFLENLMVVSELVTLPPVDELQWWWAGISGRGPWLRPKEYVAI